MSRKVQPRCRHCGGDHKHAYTINAGAPNTKVNCKAIEAREQRKDQRALATRGMKKR